MTPLSACPGQIQRTLVKDSSGLYRCEEGGGDASPLYGLRQTDLSLIRPSYDQLKKTQPDGKSATGDDQLKKTQPDGKSATQLRSAEKDAAGR